jgi:hypothetical protein
VGGRLAGYWRNWLVIGADQWIVNMLRDGYRWEFTELPRLSKVPVQNSKSGTSQMFVAMQDQVAKLLEIRAVEEVLDCTSPGFYSRFFIVPKKEPGK